MFNNSANIVYSSSISTRTKGLKANKTEVLSETSVNTSGAEHCLTVIYL